MRSTDPLWSYILLPCIEYKEHGTIRLIVDPALHVITTTIYHRNRGCSVSVFKILITDQWPYVAFKTGFSLYRHVSFCPKTSNGALVWSVFFFEKGPVPSILYNNKCETNSLTSANNHYAVNALKQIIKKKNNKACTIDRYKAHSVFDDRTNDNNPKLDRTKRIKYTNAVYQSCFLR